MKLRRLLAVLLLLALAGTARAQTHQILTFGTANGGNWNTALAESTTNLGALTAAQAASPAFVKWTADSIIYTAGLNTCRHAVLYWRVIPAGGDTTSLATYAVAIKIFSASSHGAVQIGQIAVEDSLAGTASPVSVTAGFGPPTVPAGSGVGLWPGEYQLGPVDPWSGRTAATGAKSNQFYGLGTHILDFQTLLGISDLPAAHGVEVRFRLLHYNDADVTKKPGILAWIDCSN